MLYPVVKDARAKPFLLLEIQNRKKSRRRFNIIRYKRWENVMLSKAALMTNAAGAIIA